jgi:hypothetical protein
MAEYQRWKEIAHMRWTEAWTRVGGERDKDDVREATEKI